MFNRPGRTKSDNYGFYFFMDQMLYKENSLDNQGLIFFSVFTYSPQEEINKFPFYYAGGLAYVGLINNRDQDKTGFAFLIGEFSDDLPQQDYEMILELTYKIQALKWLIVQPQMQYVVHPDGNQNIDDTLVLGFKFELEL
jgi:porin